MAKTFPPKFSQTIKYPAIYNLQDYDIPAGFDITGNTGAYFSVQFPGYNVNGTPTLSYGKHKFSVYVMQPDPNLSLEGYELPGGLPRLKTGSRILFEVLDSVGNVVYSDVIPNYDFTGFTGYLWIKQDPLRTFDDIQDGTGYLRIVAKTDNPDPNWRNRYNLRFTHPLTFNLTDSQGNPHKNSSPILFQNTTSSMGSGSGLLIEEFIDEDRNNDDPQSELCYAHISCSKLNTWSGEVQSITTHINVSGSFGYEPLSSHQLTSSIYENEIDADYSAGINTLSEKFKVQIPVSIITRNGSQGNNVKFKLTFNNPDNERAKHIDNPVEDFELIYPNDENQWLNFMGPVSTQGTSLYQKIYDNQIVHTSEGQFSFAPTVYSAPSGSGGQTFKQGVGKMGLKTSGPAGGGSHEVR